MNFKLNQLLYILCVFSYTVVSAQTVILYDFDEDLDGFQIFGATGSPTLTHTINNGLENSGSIQYSLDQSASSGGLFNNTNVPISDWSAYDNIFFYVKADSFVSGNTIKIEFEESSGEVWGQETPIEPTTDFQEISINLVSSLGPLTDGFEVVFNAGDNFMLDLDDIVKVNLVVNHGGSTPPDRVTYTIDEIGLRLIDVQPTLVIDVGDIDFNGPISADASDFRFSSDTFSVNYATPIGSDWEIRVYTSNPANALGLIGVNSNNEPILDENGQPESRILLKVDPGADNDEDNDVQWSGLKNPDFDPDQEEDKDSNPRFITESSFLVVRDIVNTAYTLIASSSDGSEPVDDYPVNFAIEAAGAVQGKYATEVTFELYIAD
jgi:hypothetical protein